MHPMKHFAADDTAARKRLFLGLITATSLLMTGGLALLWIVPSIGLANIHFALPYVAGTVTVALIVIVLWAWLSLVLHIMLRRPVLLSQKLRGVTVKFMLPLMTLLGMLLGISKEKVRNSFIKVNNELVMQDWRRHPADRILLLLPHCLQASDCPRRLTYNVNNCKRCGRCPICELLALAEAYGVRLAIATGGTIARRIVVQTRPRLIIAVACERDLASGIQDAYPIPVFGVLNERPCGPCLDTRVDLDAVRAVLARVVEAPAAALPLARSA
ncbi:DUF116 domain-containing protein [Megalodesulfovibrio gigas]|uniref:DUF116 domain-containing protein n=1 Tax=Megalodesulfovibrio gigas (strain ATCC 19364 / DSM 1382 / NCIMB 9332 / VKM B-1759) TaxID=1121448 RepID=T2G836_MEGG1|nr:DUF116 domain-containing protein [Megalodesulfovibrio gigas]AGW12745.1 putative protein of unknown function DUF116 [Megalodesulfovibrio gigas DSM 1382 = ATCC 19364]